VRSATIELFGRLIEVQESDLGAQTVLLDGRVVSRKPFAGWIGASHFLELYEDGAEHVVEIRRGHTGLRFTSVQIRVDGRLREVLKHKVGQGKSTNCPYCRYSLLGQRPVSETAPDEIRCPECGRHTTLGALGLSSIDDLAADA
jgi:DNA-directed RNA polymerase subunit RPC12/RpoP